MCGARGIIAYVYHISSAFLLIPVTGGTTAVHTVDFTGGQDPMEKFMSAAFDQNKRVQYDSSPCVIKHKNKLTIICCV